MAYPLYRMSGAAAPCARGDRVGDQPVDFPRGYIGRTDLEVENNAGQRASWSGRLENLARSRRAESRRTAVRAYRLASDFTRVEPAAGIAAIAARLDGVLRGGGDEGDARVAERLPGLDLVAATDLSFRLTLPGPIAETNADRVEGNTAVWVFGLSDALLEPVQLYARARVGD